MACFMSSLLSNSEGRGGGSQKHLILHQNIQYSPVSGVDSFTFVFVTSLFIFIKEWIICNRSLSGACGYNSAIEECINSSSCDPRSTHTHTHTRCGLSQPPRSTSHLISDKDLQQLLQFSLLCSVTLAVTCGSALQHSLMEVLCRFPSLYRHE